MEVSGDFALWLPRSNASSAHWHRQDTSCLWRRQFIKEQLKARDHHTLKHQGKSSECIHRSCTIQRGRCSEHQAQVYFQAVRSSSALKEHAGTSQGKAWSSLQQTQLHKAFFSTGTRNQELEDNFSLMLLSFAPSNKTPFGHVRMESTKQVLSDS